MWSWPTGPACRWRSWPQRPSRGLGGYGASRSCCSRSWARQDFPSEYHTILRDSVTIPVGTAFQFRNTGFEPLAAVGVTMPPWPGEDEAMEVAGPWAPQLTA